MGHGKRSTTAAGAAARPVPRDDRYLQERLAHLNRERIPERVIHAKGAGAHGSFIVTGDISRDSKAHLFGAIGRTTPVFVRFSALTGGPGAADTVRDTRGFAIKFYTEEGNWDLVAASLPVFPVRDPLAFPDFVHSHKPHPHTGRPCATSIWDFRSHTPASLHHLTMLMSDRGIPKTFRHMNGYGGHAFALIDGDGQRVWCKWHLQSRQGVRNFEHSDEAHRIAGEHPDYHRQDLFEAIARDDRPAWTLYAQILPDQQALHGHPPAFDATRVWPHADCPLVEVGELVLDRNPENYFAEVEQAAFSPANLPPGLGPSPDRVLQARLLAYADAQHYRLGVGHGGLGINRPRCPAHDRDGRMRLDDDQGREANHRSGGVSGPEPSAEPAHHYDAGRGSDDYEQAGALFRDVLDVDARKRLIGNIVASLRTVAPHAIKLRQIRHFYQADPAYGEGVAAGLGIDLEEALNARDEAVDPLIGPDSRP